jgi:hypothetical protein
MKIADSFPNTDMFRLNAVSTSNRQWPWTILLRAGAIALAVLATAILKSPLVVLLVFVAMYIKLERVENSVAELKLSVSKLRADAETLSDRLPQGQGPEAFNGITVPANPLVDPDLLALQRMLGLGHAEQLGLSSPNRAPTDEP